MTYLMRRIKLKGLNKNIRVRIIVEEDKRLVTAYIPEIKDFLSNYFDNCNSILDLKDVYISKAKCHEKDEFDKEFGINLAFERVVIKFLKDLSNKINKYLIHQYNKLRIINKNNSKLITQRLELDRNNFEIFYLIKKIFKIFKNSLLEFEFINVS